MTCPPAFSIALAAPAEVGISTLRALSNLPVAMTFKPCLVTLNGSNLRVLRTLSTSTLAPAFEVVKLIKIDVDG